MSYKKGTFKHSLKTRKLMSESSKGSIPWNKGLTKKIDERLLKFSKYMKKHHSGKNHSMYGKKRSKETIKKMSDGRKGIKASDDTKQRMSDAQKGKKLSYAHRHKIKTANLSCRKRSWNINT